MSTGMEPVCPPPRRLKQFEGVSMDEICFLIPVCPPPRRLKQFEGVSMDEICFLILFPGRQII